MVCPRCTMCVISPREIIGSARSAIPTAKLTRPVRPIRGEPILKTKPSHRVPFLTRDGGGCHTCGSRERPYARGCKGKHGRRQEPRRRRYRRELDQGRATEGGAQE